jgi:hypothetical protein
MPRFSAVLSFFLTICFGFSVSAGDISGTSPYHLTTLRPASAGKRINVFQNGYVFGAANIPMSSHTSDGKIKAGYGVGFEGSVFLIEQLGIVTHFSTSYNSVDLTQSNIKGGSLNYWIMPGVIYQYEISSTRTELIAIHALAMAGVEIYKPFKSINETGSSGSLSYALGIGVNYNYIKLGIRYMCAKPKFDYTIYPNDYTAKLKSSFLQISLGYTFDFYPRRKSQ